MENTTNNAVERVKRFLSTSQSGFEARDEEVEKAYASFQAKFNPEKQEVLSDDELLPTIFLCANADNNSLCYYLEFDSKIKNFFGSISGWSSYKFGLFQRQDD